MFFILLTLAGFLTVLEKMGRSMMSWNMCGYKGDRLVYLYSYINHKMMFFIELFQ